MKEAAELKESISELKKEKANLESDVVSLRLDIHDEVRKLQQIRIQANSSTMNTNWHAYGRNY
jgi:predicted  nucleic acid-binding Zn-ribbon protein